MCRFVEYVVIVVGLVAALLLAIQRREEAAARLEAHDVAQGPSLVALEDGYRSERPQKDWRACLESREPSCEPRKRVPTRRGRSAPARTPDGIRTVIPKIGDEWRRGAS